MNAFVPIRVAAQGWHDDGLASAYRTLERLYNSLPDDSDAASAILHAMEAIDAADCDLQRECGR